MSELVRVNAPAGRSFEELANVFELAGRLAKAGRVVCTVSVKHLDYDRAFRIYVCVSLRERVTAETVCEAVAGSGLTGILCADNPPIGLARVRGDCGYLTRPSAKLAAFDSRASLVAPTQPELAVTVGSDDPVLRLWFSPETDLAMVRIGEAILRSAPVAASQSEESPLALAFAVCGAKPPRGCAPERTHEQSPRRGVLRCRLMISITPTNPPRTPEKWKHYA